jgi:VanZ family protein
MPPGHPHNNVALMWIFKVLMLIPLAMAAFAARDKYLFVKENPEMRQSPPYNEHVELAHFLTYIGVCLRLTCLILSLRMAFLWIVVISELHLSKHRSKYH